MADSTVLARRVNLELMHEAQTLWSLGISLVSVGALAYLGARALLICTGSDEEISRTLARDRCLVNHYIQSQTGLQASL